VRIFDDFFLFEDWFYANLVNVKVLQKAIIFHLEKLNEDVTLELDVKISLKVC